LRASNEQGYSIGRKSWRSDLRRFSDHLCQLQFAFFRLGLFDVSNSGSPRLDELRWRKPVRPDDTIRSEIEVTEVT